MTLSEKKIILIITNYVGFNLLNFSVKGLPVEELRFKIIKKYGGKEIVDYVIANSGEISEEIKSRYLEEGSTLAKLDIDNLKDLNVEVICDDLIKIKDGTVKHNADKLAEILADTIMEKKLLYDRKKIIEYMYLSQRIKDREKSNKEIGL